ncbi:hypothetical protein [Caldalkalibacillus mannanilyticus]|uniref:hypothetical protein n=1 Tax=Caldalkalibacillus mannanilyticus TaxID=1418 RepID=UPI000469F0D5|nr:hypothetical protein [Caldalkalibacillus mannanilyticus]
MSSDKSTVFKLLVSCLTIVLFFAFVLPTNVATALNQQENDELMSVLTDNEISLYAHELDYEMLEDIFKAIENIPDDLIEAEDTKAITEWINNNTTDALEVSDEGVIVTFGVVGCASAVGVAILTNVIPIAKLAKVKDALKAAGGATTFVRALLTNYDLYRSAGYAKKTAIQRAINKAASEAGPEIRRALLDFFNVGSVYSACFE